MKFLDNLLLVKTEKRNFFQIIFWWELRRFLYNLIVLVSVALSLIIVAFYTSKNDKEDWGEPILGIFLFVLLCNVVYTFGWVIELFVQRSANFAPKLFKSGLFFTLFFVYLPLLLCILDGIWSFITKFLHLK